VRLYPAARRCVIAADFLSARAVGTRSDDDFLEDFCSCPDGEAGTNRGGAETISGWPGKSSTVLSSVCCLRRNGRRAIA